LWSVCGSVALAAVLLPATGWAAGPATCAEPAGAPQLAVPGAAGGVDVALTLPAVYQPGAAAGQWSNAGQAARVEFLTAIAGDGEAGRRQGLAVGRIPPAPSGAARQVLTLGAAASASAAGPGFSFKPLDDKSLELREGDRPVFVYNYGMITCPKVPEKDNRRTRSSFVHPLYGLGGEVISEAFPKDHYHHVGLFWAWPHVQIDGKEYDLWTYKEIHQEFRRWLLQETSPTAAQLAVENAWVIGGKDVLIERVWLRTYAATADQRAIDITLFLIPRDKPVTLWGAPQKSYGGINFRILERKKEDTKITVADGVTKDDLPDTRLTWADLTAKLPGVAGINGVAIFVDPRHPDYPPTWLTRHYGILCVGWPGVKPHTFQPGQPVRLDYRLLIHKSAGDDVAQAVEQNFPRLRAAYEAYQAAAQATWE